MDRWANMEGAPHDLSNAIVARPKAIEITVRLDDLAVYVFFADTDQGIDPLLTGRIFNPFSSPNHPEREPDSSLPQGHPPLACGGRGWA